MPEATQWSISLRPQSLNDVWGQDKLKENIYARLKSGKGFPKAIFLQGRYGTGKTTVSKILAKMIQCKTPKPNGDPCCECMSCKSIENETYGRNTYCFDGGPDGTIDKVREKIGNWVNIQPMKDNNVVIMIEEVQEISSDGINALLKMIEDPKKRVYFLMTAMEEDSSKLKKINGLMSRCQIFRYPPATPKDIMFYLKDCMEKMGYWDSPEIPQEFKGKGLYTIATNCNGSFRSSLQMLEQFIDSKTFTEEEIRQNAGIINLEDFYGVLQAILEGKPSDSIMNTLLDADCEKQFRLAMKVISDAESYRIFGKVPGDNEFFVKNAAALSSHKNFDILLNGFIETQKSCATYFNKSIYVLSICEMIRKCMTSTSAPVVLNETQQVSMQPPSPNTAVPVQRQVIPQPTVQPTVVNNSPVQPTTNSVEQQSQPTQQVVRRIIRR